MEFVQLQINYLDWESEWVQSEACYEVATKHNKPIIVMEPVKGGTLARVPGMSNIGQCEGVCPQHLHIIEKLKEVSRHYDRWQLPHN